MKLFKKITSVSVAALICLAATPINGTISDDLKLTAKEEDFTYTVQEIRIAVNDTNRNLNIYSSEEGSYLNSWTLNGTGNEKWYLNYIS